MTIRELRKERNLTQEAFAASIGVSVVSVRAYEAGRTVPGEKVRSAIRDRYGVDVALVEKKPAGKKVAAAKPAAKKAEPKQKKAATARKRVAAKKEPQIIVQSPLGGEITPFAILAKVGQDVDKVYIRVDLNKAFWVRGSETGNVDLW